MSGGVTRLEVPGTVRIEVGVVVERRPGVTPWADHAWQPREVLEFFRDTAETAGLRLETAGTLFGGRKLIDLRIPTGKPGRDGDGRAHLSQRLRLRRRWSVFRHRPIQIVERCARASLPSCKGSHR